MISLLFALAAACGQDGDAAWRKFINDNVALEDDQAALREIDAKRAELTRDAAKNRVRLAELEVRCRIARVALMKKAEAALEAIRLLEEEVKEEPEHVYARYLLAQTCLGLPAWFKRREAGLAQCRWLVDRETKRRGSAPYPDAFVGLAREEAGAGRRERAAEIVAAGRASFPDDADLRELAVGLAAGAARGDFAKARDAFHDALRRGRLEFGPLDGALREAGDVASLQRGLLRLWVLEASRRDAGAATGRTAGEAIELLEKARRLDPADSRIDGWLGSVKTAVGLRASDAELEREGWKLLDAGVERHAEFNLFVRALARQDRMELLPEGDRAGAAAGIEEDLYRTIESATGGRMDRARFLPPERTAESSRAGSRDSANAPFNRSGTLFWAGEFFRQRGSWRKATDAYAEASRADAGKAWPYRALAEGRRAHAEAMLKGPDGAKGALPAAPVSCLLCHRTE